MALDNHQMAGLDSKARKVLNNIFNNWFPSTAMTLSGKTYAGNVLDASGYILRSSGTSVPTATTAGYTAGSKFVLEGATLGQCPNWINQGSVTSCLFVPFGPVLGYGFAFAGGPVDLEDAAALTTVSLPGVIQPGDLCFATKGVTTGADQFRSIAPTSGKDSLAITVNASNPTDSMDAYYAGVRNKCVPEYDIFAAGEYIAVAGDDATVAIDVIGVLATDIAFVTPLTTDDADTINLVVCSADTVTVTVSADPEVAHSYSYIVLRKRGTFEPSHFIAYAGSADSEGGDTDEDIDVVGALATDIVIAQWKASNDDDCFIETAIMSADSLAYTTTDDPVAAEHTIQYLVLRAY